MLDAGLQHAEPARFTALFTAFVAGYARHFSGDEAEPTGEWPARIAGRPPPQPVMRIVVAVERGDGAERVIGGIAAEYYRAAGCVLATYGYVSDEAPYRRRGHARALLEEARAACRALGPVRAILAEAEWPELLQSRGEPPAKVARARALLGFFARLGARRVDVDYVQPALGPGQRPVSWLRLFLLPAGDGEPIADDELAPVVGRFLAEFYAGLAEGTGTAADGATLERLTRQLAGRRPLTLPLLPTGRGSRRRRPGRAP